MQKIIAVDMDDVCVNLLQSWLIYLNNKYGTNVQYEDITDWDMRKFFPELSAEQIFEPLHEKELWRTVTPRPDAMNYLKLLHKEGFKILIVTASHHKNICTKLEVALFPYFDFLTYKDIVMCQYKDLIKCDYIVDDNPENLRNSDAVRFLMSAPHNKKLYEAGVYTHKVDNWSEIYKLIHRMEDNDV